MSTRYAFLVLKLLVTSGLLWLAMRNIDFSSIPETLSNVDPARLSIGIALLVFLPLIGTVRWRIVVTALQGHMNFYDAARLTYIGTFLNQALPATVGGDAAKIYLTVRLGHTLRLAANSIALDRVVLLLTLLFLVALGAPQLSSDVAGFRALLPAIMLAAVCSIFLVCFADKLPEQFQKLRVFQILSAIAVDSRSIFASPKALLTLIPLVVAGYGLMSLSVYFLVTAFGEQLGFWLAMSLIPAVLLASVLPISIGGWGAREAAMVALLGFAGVDAGSALAASVLFGLSSILVTTPAIVMYLANKTEVDHAIAGGDGPTKSQREDA